MIKKKFEELVGFNITDEQYDYISNCYRNVYDISDIQEFCKYISFQNLPLILSLGKTIGLLEKSISVHTKDIEERNGTITKLTFDNGYLQDFIRVMFRGTSNDMLKKAYIDKRLKDDIDSMKQEYEVDFQRCMEAL